MFLIIKWLSGARTGLCQIVEVEVEVGTHISLGSSGGESGIWVPCPIPAMLPSLVKLDLFI